MSGTTTGGGPPPAETNPPPATAITPQEMLEAFEVFKKKFLDFLAAQHSSS
ncbi:MAG: hypothetical protein KGL39_04640 [Patescibacteria group bacterium]|nr:hypothetical protein [Patescibacteria group bacterium]